MMTRPPSRLWRTLLFVAVTAATPLFLLDSVRLRAQSFEHTPFVETVPSAEGDAVMVRHATANGITADISVSTTDGGWNQGIRTDGWPHHELVHLYLQSTDSNAVFAYDLLLEPVAGTHQIRGTFSPQSPEVFAEEKHDARLVPLPPGELAPILVDEGGTLAITMFADAEKRLKITQYLHLRLSTAKEQAALSFPVTQSSCRRVR